MRRLIISIAVLVLVCAALLWSWSSWSSDIKKVGVAVYSDEGVWDDSVKALVAMFSWMHVDTTLVSADYVNTHNLDGFNLLCIPGGDMYEYGNSISSTGRQNIKNFLSKGGGYIGVCGGAYYASKAIYWRGAPLPVQSLGIFPGSASGPVDQIMPYPNYTMCKVNIVKTNHPITVGQPSSEWVLYYWGPALSPNVGTNVTVLGNYDLSNATVMVAFEYGAGRVFLIGTHPEIEEDSTRDNVVFGDDLNDQGSEWELMRTAFLWCTKRAQ